MSSSDDEGTVKAVKKTKTNSKKAGSKTEKSSDFQIKPAKGGPSMDTANWPLLLKVRPSQTLGLFDMPFSQDMLTLILYRTSTSST
jgi:hypothetical protein